MDITVYLPDDIGARAKEQGLKLSRLLRDAVIKELERRDALAEALSTATAYELDLVDENGYGYTGRITGTRVHEDPSADASIYLTTDGRVIAVLGTEHWVLDNPVDDLRTGWVEPEDYPGVLRALGLKPVIDL